MNHRTFCNHYYLAMAFLVLTFSTQLANAANAPISGSYEVVKKTDLGPQTKVLVCFHLMNHGQSPLTLQGVLLSDFAHPPSGAALPSAITLHPGVSGETSQEFVITRLQFEQWQKGVFPRVVLQLQTAKGARITQAVRLERVPARKGE